MIRRLVVCFCIALLTACASPIPKKTVEKKISLPALPDSHFKQSEIVPSTESLLELTQEQQEAFFAYFHSPQHADVDEHVRLFNYLDNRVAGFDYRGDTYDATTALSKRAGNCVSLAMITTALAKLANVEIGFQKIHASPIYKQKDNVILLSHHVRTFLYDPNWRPQESLIVFRRPRLIVDYFPDRGDIGSEAITQDEFLSMYYRNKASEFLIEKAHSKAYTYISHALKLAPHDPENVNLLSVLLRRANLENEAEKFYVHGIKHNPDSSNLLSNYQVLLEKLGRDEEVAAIAEKLQDIPDQNPYAWIKLGHEAYERGHYSVAIRYYEIAQRKAPYLDDVYFGLAKSLYALGHKRQAADAMQLAAEKAFEQSTRDLYYSKLAVLSGKRAEQE